MYRFRNQVKTSIQHLRWKLAIRYGVITTAVFFVIAIVFLHNLTTYVNQGERLTPDELVEMVSSAYVPLVSRYLSTDPPDIRDLQMLLEKQEQLIINVDPIRIGDYVFKLSDTNNLAVLFLNADRRLIGSLPSDLETQTAIGEGVSVEEFVGLSDPLGAAQEGSLDSSRITTRMPGGTIVGAIPIIDINDENNPLGYLAFEYTLQPAYGSRFIAIAREFGSILLVIALIIWVVATIFGFITARNFEERIRKMMVSVQSWSRGNFASSIDEPSADELGRMAQNLNIMVKKVEILLDESHNASVLEERKRLARDLHDSFKQQTFAASALLGAARSHFGNNLAEAEAQLIEAEKVLNEVRVGLTEFIRELRPSALEGRGLINAISEYSQDCSDQNDIDIKVRVEGGRRLPLNVERTLFRIVQGALSNVVRHSDATSAEVNLTYDTTSITLVIRDNGVGFDTTIDHRGLGIRSIRERVELINGSLKIESGIDQGTTITIKCIY
jgi:NarL family two-component system sensor histidine kinase LiaS